MAYNRGTFYIDLYNGNDGVRSAFSGSAYNPSGTTVRISGSHGLTSGAIVDLTAFTAWLNSAWEISVVDSTNFDLVSGSWQAAADPNGTVTPRGGGSWIDPWRTVSNGATAARIQPGDILRVSKTPDPVELGVSASWTDLSQTVLLDTAVTKTINQATGSVSWNPLPNISIASTSTRKLGASTSTQITPAAGFTTGLMASAAVDNAPADFSAYTSVNLWMFPFTTTQTGSYTLCLCSDVSGSVIVDSFPVPYLYGFAMNACNLRATSSLGSSIRSVALYANVDPGTSAIVVNNIFATNNLTLDCLFGKSGDVNYNIQSVVDRVVKIDSNNTTATGRGYSGTTETASFWYRQPLIVSGNINWAFINEVGNSLNAPNEISFGWNTGSNALDGITCVANNSVGQGTAIYGISVFYYTISNATFARFGNIYTPEISTVDNLVWCGGGTYGGFTTFRQGTFTRLKVLNSSSTFTMVGSVIIKDSFFNNNTATPMSVGPLMNIISCSFSNNVASFAQSGTALNSGTGTGLFRNCIFNDAIEMSSITLYNGFTWSYNHDDIDNNHWGFTTGGTINWDTTVTQSIGNPGSWKISNTGTTRTINEPIVFKVADIAVNSGSRVDVGIWLKKSHATNIGAKLYIEDAAFNVSGIVASSSFKSNDTNWELISINFTPTYYGVVPVFVASYYVSASAFVNVGPVEVSQA